MAHFRALFCNNVEKYSPVHLARKLKKAPTQQLTTLFPPIAILHGSLDKTVSYEVIFIHQMISNDLTPNDLALLYSCIGSHFRSNNFFDRA